MPFNLDLVQVSTKKQSKKSGGKYINLSYGEKGTITFSLKDCYSHFGVTYSKEYKSYSIGISVSDTMYDRLRAIEEKVKTFLDNPSEEPLLRRLQQNGEFNNFDLKLNEDQFDKGMLNEEHLTVDAQITLSSVYLGYVYPTLLVRATMPECDVIETSNDEEEHSPSGDGSSTLQHGAREKPWDVVGDSWLLRD